MKLAALYYSALSSMNAMPLLAQDHNVNHPEGQMESKMALTQDNPVRAWRDTEIYLGFVAPD